MICINCGAEKTMSEMTKNRAKPGGITKWCKTCRNEYNREHYKRNKLRISTRSKIRYASNPNLRENNRRIHLKNNYGITVQEYEQLLESQGGKCAICKNDCASGNRLAVDHNHATGIVRGLLCKVCNRQVGQIERPDTQLILYYLKAYEVPHD